VLVFLISGLVGRGAIANEEYRSYQKFYEEQFEKATAWFEKDAAAFLRAGYARGKPEGLGKAAMTSRVNEDGGWFGG
jgi:soluble epoxide hydrolase/lipid-phosphate phosphatase